MQINVTVVQRHESVLKMKFKTTVKEKDAKCKEPNYLHQISRNFMFTFTFTKYIKVKIAFLSSLLEKIFHSGIFTLKPSTFQKIFCFFMVFSGDHLITVAVSLQHGLHSGIVQSLMSSQKAA